MQRRRLLLLLLLLLSTTTNVISIANDRGQLMLMVTVAGNGLLVVFNKRRCVDDLLLYRLLPLVCRCGTVDDIAIVFVGILVGIGVSFLMRYCRRIGRFVRNALLLRMTLCCCGRT